MFLSHANKKETSSLIVFIESGTVRLGIVLTTPGELPTLVYETARPFKSSDAPDQLVSRMLAALAEGCADVTKEALPHIISRRIAKGAFDSIRFIYGAPWYLSRGRVITVEKTTPTAYTSATLETLIHEHSGDIIPEPYKDAVCIERFATHWKINGYEVYDPVGKPGTRLSFDLFVSAVPTGVKNAVEESVARSFRAHTVSHHSIALMASQALMQKDDDESQALFIHISEYVTEISLVSADTIIDSITFPEGTAHFHKAWSVRSGRPHHEAATHAKHATLGNIDVTDSWRAGMGECLGALTAHHLPERIMLLGDTTIRQRAFDVVHDISGAVFGRSLSGSMLTEGSFNALVNVAAGAAPGSPAMRLLTLVVNQ